MINIKPKEKVIEEKILEYMIDSFNKTYDLYKLCLKVELIEDEYELKLY